MTRLLRYVLTVPPDEAQRRIRPFAVPGPPYSLGDMTRRGRQPQDICVESQDGTFTLSTWRGTGKYYDPGSDCLFGVIEPTATGCVVQATVPHRLGRKISLAIIAFFLSFLLFWIMVSVAFIAGPALGLSGSRMPNEILIAAPLLYVAVLVFGLQIDTSKNTQGEKALIDHLDRALESVTEERQRS